MKKFLLTVCICFAAIVGASAQERGDMAVGLNLGVAPCLEKGASSVTNFGIGAKFQYNVTTPIRLEADVDYWFKSKGMEMFDVSANAHYLFKITDKINVYPLVGIGYARVKGSFDIDLDDLDDDYDFDYYSRSWDDEDDEDYEFSASSNKLLVNVGVGAEYKLTSNLSVGLEVKYQYVKNFSRLPINLGVTYRF